MNKMNKTIKPINDGRNFKVVDREAYEQALGNRIYCGNFKCNNRNFDCEVNPNYVEVCPRRGSNFKSSILGGEDF